MALIKTSWVHDYESAKKWIQGGRSKVSRPLYRNSLSVRLVEPDNPETDITMHYRWRHITQGEQAETLDRSSFKTRWERTRYPILIFKHDGSVILSDEHKYYAGPRRVMTAYSGLVDIYRSGGVIKIRQETDEIIPSKRKPRACKACSGDKYIVYTCWEGSGPQDREVLDKCYAHVTCHWANPEHMTHIVKAKCIKCHGLGYTVPRGRWNSLTWKDGCDVTITKTKVAKEEPCS